MQLGNWIRQTTTTTGTGNLTLATVTGWAAFSSQFAAGADGACDYFYYSILDDSTGAPLEAGIGRLSDSTTLVREHVLATISSGTYSTADSPLSLPAGTKRVICADLASVRPINVPGVRAADTNKHLLNGLFRSSAGNSKSLATGSIYFTPFLVRTPALVSGFGVRVTGVASSSMRMGLYRTKLDLTPGDLIDGTADIDTTTSDMKIAAFSGGNRRLLPGLYFAAFKTFGANVTVFAYEANARIFQDNALGGDPTHATAGSNLIGFGDASYSTQALPSSAPSLTYRSGVGDYTPACTLTQVSL